MGIWPWQCTPTGLDNSTEVRMEKIHQAVTEIWVPQVWQPPARPPARTVTTIPLQPGGLRGKKVYCIVFYLYQFQLAAYISNKLQLEWVKKPEVSKFWYDRIFEFPAHILWVNMVGLLLSWPAVAPAKRAGKIAHSKRRQTGDLKKNEGSGFLHASNLEFYCWNGTYHART